jgi:hypothetical protein
VDAWGGPGREAYSEGLLLRNWDMKKADQKGQRGLFEC